jgi:hypothetical protein
MQFNDKFNVQVQGERYFFEFRKENNKYYFLDLETRYVVKKNKLTFFLWEWYLLKLSKLQCFGYQYFKDRVSFTAKICDVKNGVSF